MEFAECGISRQISYLTLSPDDKMIAYVSPTDPDRGLIMNKSATTASWNEIEFADGATYPFLWPDHTYVAFFTKKIS